MKLRRAAILRERTGLTLVEVLVATMVLTVGILAVISIFFAGGRLGRRSVRRAEAARLGRAVANYMERQTDPERLVTDSPIYSHTVGTGWSGDASPVNLVWQCAVSEHLSESSTDARLYTLNITVSADADGYGQFDAEDTPVATFVTQMAPRP